MIEKDGKNMSVREIKEKFADVMKYMLLATPFTQKGQDAITFLRKINIDISLTEKDFLEEIYVDPLSYKEFKKIVIEEPDKFDGDFIDISTDEDDRDDIRMNNLSTVLSEVPNAQIITEVQKNTDVQTTTYDTSLSKEIKYKLLAPVSLERKIENLIDGVYILKGGAGSGKTTLCNKLKNLFESKIDFHIYNLENYKRVIVFYDDGENRDIAISMKKFSCGDNDNILKFVSILLYGIRNILKEGNNAKYEIKEIGDHYLNSFKAEGSRDEDDYNDFFRHFTKYESNNKKFFFEEITQEIKKYLDVYKIDNEKTVNYIAGIFIRFLFCLYKIDNKMHLCVIDNIERYIGNATPLLDSEVESIIKGINKAEEDFKELIKEYKNHDSNYTSSSGFMLCVRDTSYFVESVVHFSEDNKNVWNISNWFQARDIYYSKLKYFEKHYPGLIDSIITSYKTTFDIIMDDISTFGWSLHDTVTNIYGGNFRRFYENVVKALSLVDIDDIEYFNNTWKTTISKINEYKNNDSKRTKWEQIKHICRRFIIRCLLDHINVSHQETRAGQSFLEKLLENNRAITRKIITKLYRHQLNDPSNPYMSFYDLLKATIASPNSGYSINKANCDEVAELLCLMNEVKTEDHWNSLVDIKFISKKEFEKENLSNQLLDCWENHKNSKIEKYAIKITPSGRFFAKIIADFEYFACLRKNGEYLFLPSSLKWGKEKIGQTYVEDFLCISYIKKTIHWAKNCIDAVIENDKDFFGSQDFENSDFKLLDNWSYKEKGGKGNNHPSRILENCKNYLSMYAVYLQEVDEIHFEKSEHRNKIINKVKDLHKGIIESLSEYQKKYPKYFKH